MKHELRIKLVQLADVVNFFHHKNSQILDDKPQEKNYVSTKLQINELFSFELENLFLHHGNKFLCIFENTVITFFWQALFTVARKFKYLK